jgi:hypothetical protein
MPRGKVDYKKGLIYTIKSGDSIYVGSTTDFRRRKSKHKCCIYNEKQTNYHLKLYQTIRENNGVWDMQPYKEFSCENKTQLTIEEDRVRRELNADLNMNCCHHNKKIYMKEWYEKNKEKKRKQNREYGKEWYEKNKEKKRKQNREYMRKKRFDKKEIENQKNI